jgi:hypothetical protein
MQSNLSEMTQVRAAAQAGVGRLNLYAGIHKALRAFLADTLLLVGRTDPADTGEVARALAQVDLLLEFCADHVGHENGFVHPALEARCPGISSPVAQDHLQHLHHIAQLEMAAAELRRCDDPADRELSLHSLYLALALFVADNLQHMHVEETVHNAALWNAYTDQELMAVHDALVASIPPAKHLFTMRWMLPHLSAPERLAVLGGMRQGAPAEAFQAVMDIVRAHLDDRDWAKVASGLGVAAAPGLAAV